MKIQMKVLSVTLVTLISTVSASGESKWKWAQGTISSITASGGKNPFLPMKECTFKLKPTATEKYAKTGGDLYKDVREQLRNVQARSSKSKRKLDREENANTSAVPKLTIPIAETSGSDISLTDEPNGSDADTETTEIAGNDTQPSVVAGPTQSLPKDAAPPRSVVPSRAEIRAARGRSRPASPASDPETDFFQWRDEQQNPKKGKAELASEDRLGRNAGRTNTDQVRGSEGSPRPGSETPAQAVQKECSGAPGGGTIVSTREAAERRARASAKALEISGRNLADRWKRIRDLQKRLDRPTVFGRRNYPTVSTVAAARRKPDEAGRCTRDQAALAKAQRIAEKEAAARYAGRRHSAVLVPNRKLARAFARVERRKRRKEQNSQQRAKAEEARVRQRRNSAVQVRRRERIRRGSESRPSSSWTTVRGSAHAKMRAKVLDPITVVNASNIDG